MKKLLLLFTFLLSSLALFSQCNVAEGENYLEFNFPNSGATCYLDGCFTMQPYSTSIVITSSTGRTYQLKPADFCFADVAELMAFLDSQMTRLCAVDVDPSTLPPVLEQDTTGLCELIKSKAPIYTVTITEEIIEGETVYTFTHLLNGSPIYTYDIVDTDIDTNCGAVSLKESEVADPLEDGTICTTYTYENTCGEFDVPDCVNVSDPAAPILIDSTIIVNELGQDSVKQYELADGSVIEVKCPIPVTHEGDFDYYIQSDTIWATHIDSDGNLIERFTYYNIVSDTVNGVIYTTTEECDQNGNCTDVHESKCDLCLMAYLGQISPCDESLRDRDCDGGGFTNGLECDNNIDPLDPCDDDCLGFILNGPDICDYIAGGNPDSDALAALDCDGNGVSNLIECQNGGDPTDPSDDCQIIEDLAIDVCSSPAYGETDCDEGGVPAKYECLVGNDPDDPTDDCESAIQAQISLCGLIMGDPNHPMADLDCDENGHPNLAECLVGQNPNDGADDISCVEVTKTGTVVMDYAVGEDISWEICLDNCGNFESQSVLVTDPLDPMSPRTVTTVIPSGGQICYTYLAAITNPDSTLNSATAVLTDEYGVVSPPDDSDNGTSGDSVSDNLDSNGDPDETGDDDPSVIFPDPCCKEAVVGIVRADWKTNEVQVRNESYPENLLNSTYTMSVNGVLVNNDPTYTQYATFANFETYEDIYPPFTDLGVQHSPTIKVDWTYSWANGITATQTSYVGSDGNANSDCMVQMFDGEVKAQSATCDGSTIDVELEYRYWLQDSDCAFDLTPGNEPSATLNGVTVPSANITTNAAGLTTLSRPVFTVPNEEATYDYCVEATLIGGNVISYCSQMIIQCVE